MANAREIQSRMKSIQDTMKITNAMYMISSSKLKKARKKLADTEPYFYSTQSTISRILRHVEDVESFNSPYFDARPSIPKEDRKVGYIVVTADKGMAGAYNHNVIKLVQERLDQGGHNKLYVLGMLGRQYFIHKQVEVAGEFLYTVQRPTLNRARNIAEEMIALFCAGELDDIFIVYTKMESPIVTKTEVIQLLPLKKAELSTPIPSEIPMEQIAFYPSEEVVMNNIVPIYVTGFVYGALVESYASEQNQRMMAMEAATKSAKSMLHDLGIMYNRARQASITQEITEVVSGAKAQKNKRG